MAVSSSVFPFRKTYREPAKAYLWQMKKMYVYMLSCSDGTFYTGVTNDMERRLEEHKAGIHPESYTFSRRPLILVFHEQFNDPLSAIAFEKKLKKWSVAKKQALILKEFDWLPALSKKNLNPLNKT